MNSFEFHTKIVGTTFIPKSQERISTLENGMTLTLKCEPENKYDPNAVAVYTEDFKLGFIPKETAAKINLDVSDGAVHCVVSEVTVEGKGNAGCNIHLLVDRIEGCTVRSYLTVRS